MYSRPEFGQVGVADEALDEAPVRVEHLDAVVQPVGDVDVAVSVHVHGRRAVELPFGVAGFAHAHQELAVGAEFLDAVVAPVGDVDVAELVDRHAPGHVHLALAAALRAADGLQMRAVPREALDAVVHGVGYDDVAVQVEVKRGRAVELAVRRPLLAPLGDNFAVLVHDGYRVLRLVGDVEVLVFVHEQAGGPW